MNPGTMTIAKYATAFSLAVVFIGGTCCDSGLGGGGGADDASGSGTTDRIPEAMLSITSLDKDSAAPFSLLTISGTRFDPQNSAISVFFSPQEGGVGVAVPIISATHQTIEVIVPPFVDQASGLFSSGMVDVKVIQVSGSLLMTSNMITGLAIADLPLADPSIPPGAITAVFVAAGLDSLREAESLTEISPDPDAFLTALNAYSSELDSFLAQIHNVMNDSQQTVNLISVSRETITLDAVDLATLDQLLSAFILQVRNAISIEPSLISTHLRQKHALSECRAQSYVPPSLLDEICGGREYFSQQHSIASPLLSPAVKLSYGVPLAIIGTIAGPLFATLGGGAATEVSVPLVSSWALQLTSEGNVTVVGSLKTAVKALVFGQVAPLLLGNIPWDLLYTASDAHERAVISAEQESIYTNGAESTNYGKQVVTIIRGTGPDRSPETFMIPGSQKTLVLLDCPSGTLFDGDTGDCRNMEGCPSDAPIPIDGFCCAAGETGCDGGCIPESATCCGDGSFCRSSSPICAERDICCPAGSPQLCPRHCLKTPSYADTPS